MNTKQFIGTVVAAGMLSACGGPTWEPKATTKEIDSTVHGAKTELAKNLSKKHHNVAVNLDSVDMFDIKALMKAHDPVIKDADGKNLLWMLGSLDANAIINKYNPQIADSQPAGYDWSGSDIRSFDTLYVPRIFPSMSEFFHQDLSTFLADKPELKDSVGDVSTIIVVTELPNGKFGLGYYEEGFLQLAYPISIGDGKRHKDKKQHKWYQGRSPQGRFWVTRKQANKKSASHDSMAYFLELLGARGLGLHGQKTQSKRQSHGCFRQPQFAAKMLFDRTVASEDSLQATRFVSYWQPNEVELDSTKYFTKIHPELKEERLKRQDSIRRLLGDTLK